MPIALLTFIVLALSFTSCYESGYDPHFIISDTSTESPSDEVEESHLEEEMP